MQQLGYQSQNLTRSTLIFFMDELLAEHKILINSYITNDLHLS